MSDYWKARGSYENPLPNARDREFLVDMNTGELFMGFNGSNVKISDHALQLALITTLQDKKVLQIPDSFFGKARYALCVNSTEDGYGLYPISKGDTGAAGLSAYQIWRALGNSGSESDFIAALKGPQGDPGDGNGDMIAETYDTDGDGKVNAAETADEVEWDGVTNKPTTFPPSEHIHDYEPELAAPDVDGKVLASTTEGVKSWVSLPTGDMLASTYDPIIMGITGETTVGATPATTLKAIAAKRDVKTITICNPAADAISLKLPFKDAKTLYAVQLDSVKLTDATNPPTASSILVTPTGSTTIKIYGISGNTVSELDSNAMTTASLLHTLSTPATIPADSWVMVKIVGAVNGITCLSVGLVVG